MKENSRNSHRTHFTAHQVNFIIHEITELPKQGKILLPIATELVDI